MSSPSHPIVACSIISQPKAWSCISLSWSACLSLTKPAGRRALYPRRVKILMGWSEGLLGLSACQETIKTALRDSKPKLNTEAHRRGFPTFVPFIQIQEHRRVGIAVGERPLVDDDQTTEGTRVFNCYLCCWEFGISGRNLAGGRGEMAMDEAEGQREFVPKKKKSEEAEKRYTFPCYVLEAVDLVAPLFIFL